MELRRIRYFLRIAAEGSLGRASRELGIAQPALSRQMQLLEADLGVTLFHRVAKGMRLTEEGEYLRDALTHPLEQVEAALRNVRSVSARTETTCTLGMPALVSRVIGPPLVRQLAGEMPNLKLRLVEDSPARLSAGLLRGTVDVAILPGVAPDDRLFHAEILSEPLLLVGPRASPLAEIEAVEFASLDRYPLVLAPKPASLPIQLEKLVARLSGRMTIAHEVDAPEVQKDLVRAGLGYAIMTPLALNSGSGDEGIVGVPFAAPELAQTTHIGVQARWRVARTTYNDFHRIFYDVWMHAVDTGAWPATWLLDRVIIHSAAT